LGCCVEQFVERAATSRAVAKTRHNLSSWKRCYAIWAAGYE